MNETSTEKPENAAPAAKITLRKKAPFFCTTKIAGKSSCLKPLAETDGEFCAPCAQKQKEILERPITRIEEPARDSRFMTAQEWQDRLAKGPIWATDTTTQEVN